MARKKMFPTLGKTYDEVKLHIGFRVEAGQVVMQFSDHVEWVRMSSAGARKLAAMLTEKADEVGLLDSKGKHADALPHHDRRELPGSK
jgi:hypothetical protein